MTPDTLDRRLYVIRIIHAPADMGSLQGLIRASKEYEKTANEYWSKVSESISGIQIDRAYQDGLPDVSEENVDRVVTQAQTPNYAILRQLRSQGVLIRGTENPILCQEEYNLCQRIASPRDSEDWIEAKLAYANREQGLLEERDFYICQRIKDDLLPRETSILFIGAGHQVVSELSKYIQILEIEQLHQSLATSLRALSEMNRTNYV